MINCSKCTEPATHVLVVPTINKEPKPDKKNENGVRLVRFCDGHWSEVEALLPAAA